MPITSVTYQPNINSINAVYRPVIFRCTAKIPNATAQNYICPVVFCDIYVNGVYYKSLSRSQYIKNDGIAPEYEFDIQDAIQELMGYNLPKMDGNLIETFSNTIKKVFVKFRNCYYNANGFSISEQVAPVQGTSSVPPISGTGTISNEIYILNSAIQHEENQDLEKLLQSYRTGVWNDALPLTKRPAEYKLCRKDSSHFPIISTIKPTQICVKAKTKSGEIIDVCSEILEICPVISGISYSVVDNGDGTQTFTFDWVLPPNTSGITGLNIYSSDDPSNGWYVEPGSFTPTRTITLYLGVYDFRFGLEGSCITGEIDDLPGIDNIGLTDGQDNNPPTVLIRWNDNLGNEDRICAQSVCNFTIEVYATDPDNDIVNIQVLKSTDNGLTWNVFIQNLLVNTFDDAINATGTQLYKAVVVDSTNNTVTSNTLSYTKQQPLNDFYRKIITGISCTTTGDGPTNYSVWCTGSEDFALSDNFLINTNVGFIRLKIDPGSNELGISKSGGGALIVDEVLPITTILTGSYAAVGQNPPSAYPWGYPSNVPVAIYTFEYSINGTSGWTSFDLHLDD